MKIICVGRNYVDHIKELDNNKPKEPVLFLKPQTAIINKRQPFFIPGFSNEIHSSITEVRQSTTVPKTSKMRAFINVIPLI